MFGFSLQKLVVLVVIIGAVLVLFRFIGQRTAVKPAPKKETKAFDTEYDAESDTFVVRNGKNQDK
jgi:NADH:ubiquinone oxidoreductase subunit 6 (subunit J)